jgi:hypothetical protein
MTNAEAIARRIATAAAELKAIETRTGIYAAATADEAFVEREWAGWQRELAVALAAQSRRAF